MDSLKTMEQPLLLTIPYCLKNEKSICLSFSKSKKCPPHPCSLTQPLYAVNFPPPYTSSYTRAFTLIARKDPINHGFKTALVLNRGHDDSSENSTRILVIHSYCSGNCSGFVATNHTGDEDFPSLTTPWYFSSTLSKGKKRVINHIASAGHFSLI